jgi:hypothetical protein
VEEVVVERNLPVLFRQEKVEVLVAHMLVVVMD